MKKTKRILAILVATVMIISLMPVVTNAALKWTQNVKSTANYTGFVKNTSTLTAFDGDSASTNGYYISKAGVGADYEPVTGMFGKTDSDTSVKISRIESSTESSAIYSTGKLKDAGYYPAAGEIISINWNWAFGDFETDRYVDAKFYTGTDFSYKNVNSYAYTSSGSNTSHILALAPGGRITFFGKVLDNPLYFKTNTWYNFEIRITAGTSDAEATTDVAASKSTASLYIDGALIGSKAINNAADDATAIGKPYSVYTFAFVSNGVKYDGSSKTLPETNYIDDLLIGYYKSHTTDKCFKFIGNLNVESDSIISDGLHIALKNEMTAQEFVDSLTLGTNVKEVKLLDASLSPVTDMSANVEAGWYLNVSSNKEKAVYPSGAKGYDSFNRKIVDSINFYKVSYQGNDSTSLPAGISYSQGMGSSTTKYLVEYNHGLRDANAAFVAYKYGTNYDGAADTKIQYTTSLVPGDKYVLEMSALRSKESATYQKTSVNAGSLGTVMSLNDANVTIKTDDDEWVWETGSRDKSTDRWYMVAIEVDETLDIAKIYVNGRYTGVTRSFPDGSSLFTNFGIICKNQGEYLATAFGKSMIDDIRIYSGSYAPETKVLSGADNVNVYYKDFVNVSGDISVAEFKELTGADMIYGYENGKFTSEITDGNVCDGNVAVVYLEDTGIVRYYDINLLPVIEDVSFDSSVEGKLTAKTSIQIRGNENTVPGAVLVIAHKNGDELIKSDVCIIDDLSSVNTYNFDATIDYVSGDYVVAYFWNGSCSPLKLPAVYGE